MTACVWSCVRKEKGDCHWVYLGFLRHNGLWTQGGVAASVWGALMQPGILEEKTILLSLQRKTVGRKRRCCFNVVLPLDNWSTQKRWLVCARACARTGTEEVGGGGAISVFSLPSGNKYSPERLLLGSRNWQITGATQMSNIWLPPREFRWNNEMTMESVCAQKYKFHGYYIPKSELRKWWGRVSWN